MTSKQSISTRAKESSIDLRGSTLARNTLISFLGMGIPYLIGFAAVPFIIRGLGIERFGILSIIWVIIGYFSFIDLGLSRATTKYVAEFLGKGELDQVPKYVWTTVIMQLILGVLGTLLFLLLTPILVEHILNIPARYVGEAKSAFFIMGFSLPIILLSSSFRGVLEASQKFGLVNIIKIPISASFYVLPLIGFLLGYGLPGIVALLVAARVLSLIAWLLFSLKLYPKLMKKVALSRPALKSLLTFGGWVSLSSILYYIITSIDRFLIGSLLSVKEVAFYTAPLEVVNRFGIIPGSLSLILFPAFSSLDGRNEEERSKVLFARSVKYVIMGVGPIALMFFFYTKPFLGWWLGQDFVRNSTFVFQILCLGYLVTSLSSIPYSFLQGIGKVALVTKLQLLELGIFLTLAWLFISRWGIKGAAIAFTIKCIIVTCLFFGITWKVKRIEVHHFIQANVITSLFILGLFAVSIFGVKKMHLGLPGISFSLGFYILLAYLLVLNIDEKSYLIKLLRWHQR